MLSARAIAEAHHQGILSSINVGFRYSSLLENRGVILYRDFQIDPIFSVFLLDDRIEFLGDSIGYRDFVYKDVLRLRTRISEVTDNALFPSNDKIGSTSPDRPDSYEWSATAEWFLGGYNKKYFAEIDLQYAKDIHAHFGNYYDVQSKIKLGEFRFPIGQTLIEPNLFTALGYGDSAHNAYFYGPSANQSGFNNLRYGVWFAFSEEADRYYPIVLLTHFEVLGESNRNAEFARGRNEGWLISFIAAFGLLE